MSRVFLWLNCKKSPTKSSWLCWLCSSLCFIMYHKVEPSDVTNGQQSVKHNLQISRCNPCVFHNEIICFIEFFQTPVFLPFRYDIFMFQSLNTAITWKILTNVSYYLMAVLKNSYFSDNICMLTYIQRKVLRVLFANRVWTIIFTSISFKLIGNYTSR